MTRCQEVMSWQTMLISPFHNSRTRPNQARMQSADCTSCTISRGGGGSAALVPIVLECSSFFCWKAFAVWECSSGFFLERSSKGFLRSQALTVAPTLVTRVLVAQFEQHHHKRLAPLQLPKAKSFCLDNWPACRRLQHFLTHRL